MAIRSRRNSHGNGLEAWPGYVDALSTLLMVIIFVLLVFVLAQAFLSVSLSGRDQALDRASRQLSELSDMLSVERGRGEDLSRTVAGLTADLQTASGARDSLTRQLADLHALADREAAERDSVRADRDKLAAQLADSGLRAEAAANQAKSLAARLADVTGGADKANEAAAATALQLAEAKRQLAAMQKEMAAIDKIVPVGKETIDARISDLARLAEQARALAALRDELEKQAEEKEALATDEQQRRVAAEHQLTEETKLGESARAQVALLSRQLDDLRAQLARVSNALEVTQGAAHDKDVQIANLGQRLNTALAAKVEELQQYRSDFFGKLRAVLANRPGVQVVGDRFVFQSEVLFPTGSADVTPAGEDQIRAISATIKQIGAEIPAGLNWVLRVDGHADRQPISHGVFASNWELSAARAIAVVKLLIDDGVPATHLAATGFADFQPLDTGNTPQAYARNRRIELRLTDR
jgi:chemotaxis protein MotB